MIPKIAERLKLAKCDSNEFCCEFEIFYCKCSDRSCPQIVKLQMAVIAVLLPLGSPDTCHPQNELVDYIWHYTESLVLILP